MSQSVIICKLSKITIDSSSLSKEKRRIKNHRILQQRELRKQARRLYWKDLIKIELATILSLAWFIQMELIRTNQVPTYFTLPQMQKLPTLQLDIMSQASSVYNDMYRDRKSSQFILCDTGNPHLDGRVGYVDWFDEIHVKYHVLVCGKGFSDYENTVPMTLRPENMESVVTVNKQKYNKEAKQDNSTVGIKNFLPNRATKCSVLKFVMTRSAIYAKFTSVRRKSLKKPTLPWSKSLEIKRTKNERSKQTPPVREKSMQGVWNHSSPLAIQ